MATYYDLSALDNKLKTHQRYLQFLAIEIYMDKINLIHKFQVKNIPYSLRKKRIFKEKNHPIFKERNIPYSLKRSISFSFPNVNTQKYGISLLNFRGSVLRNSLPIKLKKCKILQEFKLL